MKKIAEIRGYEILNARGRPTVETDVILDDGCVFTASVPAGTSRGKYEAHELCDGGSRYGGKGVTKAVSHVNGIIREALLGHDPADQRRIDETLLRLDGTQNKDFLGANALLSVSVACAKAGAFSRGIPVYRHIGSMMNRRCFSMPCIIATVIAGGEFTDSGLEFEDYLYLLDGFSSYRSSLEALVAMRLTLEKQLRESHPATYEDNGALAPPLSSTAEAFEAMLRAAQTAGYAANVSLGLDVAASELYCAQTGRYHMTAGELSAPELIEYYVSLCRDFPLRYIEDGFEQDDFASSHALKAALPGVQIVGDDLFVTNRTRLKKGIETDAANTLLLKINQIGTVSEAVDTACLCHEGGYDITVSLRSGETSDDFIADFAVGAGARQIKLGSPVRGERNTKYNRLLKIEDALERGL